MRPATATIIVALAGAVLVLGYLYYDATKDDVKVKIDVPGVKIEGD